MSSTQNAQEQPPLLQQRPLVISDLVSITGLQEHRVLYAIRSRRIRPLYRLGTTRVFGPEAIPLIQQALKDVATNRVGRHALIVPKSPG